LRGGKRGKGGVVRGIVSFVRLRIKKVGKMARLQQRDNDCERGKNRRRVREGKTRTAEMGGHVAGTGRTVLKKKIRMTLKGGEVTLEHQKEDSSLHRPSSEEWSWSPSSKERERWRS